MTIGAANCGRRAARRVRRIWRAGAVLAAAPMLLGGLGVALAPGASAHAVLLNAVPANGATLAAAPAQVVFTYSEPGQAATLQFAVTDAAGATVSKAPPKVAGDTVTQPLPPLVNGTYTVAYRLVSLDGHPMGSRTKFTVADPAATAAPAYAPAVSGAAGSIAGSGGSASSAPSALPLPAPSARGSGGIGWQVGAGAVFAVALVVVSVGISRSRARRAALARDEQDFPTSL
ncbi:MAG: copper resistance protein CopC [Frankiaceae bacterium]|jgi:methionine-rich copper-binding protein CopC|nr:copper resistance protein CopC [Frankiaceae bacterium]